LFKKNKKKVLGLGHKHGFQLSLVPNAKKDDAKPQKTLQVGQKLKGTVEAVERSRGLMVKLSTGHFGMVFMCEISDDYERDPTSKFQVNQAVEVTVVKHNAEK